ncbi:MAG: hypothetical protein M2R45_02421 [Verrucomicrobia subdivision 3 bacterium]|nr:hypothetical protein [Limisphaerales bacterium]
MPKCASSPHKLAVVRSMNTKPTEHFQAIDFLNRSAGLAFIHPTSGSVLGEQLDSLIPNFILLDLCPEGNEFKSFKNGNRGG